MYEVIVNKELKKSMVVFMDDLLDFDSLKDIKEFTNKKEAYKFRNKMQRKHDKAYEVEMKKLGEVLAPTINFEVVT